MFLIIEIVDVILFASKRFIVVSTLNAFYQCATKRMRCKMSSVSSQFFIFGVTLVHVNLFLHIFTHMTVTLRGVGWGVGDYSKTFIAAEKCIVVSEKFMERFEKKY